MKKCVFLFFVFAYFVSNYSKAQTYIVHVRPVGSKIWKYADLNGNIIIDNKYPKSTSFSEMGVAVVYDPKSHLYMLIDSKGKEIRTEAMDFDPKMYFGYGTRGFVDKVINVKIDDKWGCFDTSGKLVIKPIYYQMTKFDHGYAIATTFENDILKFFVLNCNGKEIPVTEKGIKNTRHFHEDFAPFSALNGLDGYLDTLGKVAIPAKFLSVGFFNNGIAKAQDTSRLFGYINKKGEWIIKPQFIGAKDFEKESGLARVKKGEFWSYVNTNGELISFTISDGIDDFSEGLAKGKSNGLWGFYNNKGEWVIQPQFMNVGDFNNGFAIVRVNKLWGIIDKEGKWILKPTFEDMDDVVKIK